MVPPRRPPVPRDRESVLERLDLRPDRPKPLDHGRDPVRLLVAQLPCPGDHRPALGKAAQRAPPAAARRSPAAPRRRGRGWRPAGHGGRRSPPGARGRPARGPPRPPPPRPSGSAIPSRPIRVGLRPTCSSRTRLPGTSAAATRGKAADEKSPGTEIRSGASRSAGRTAIRRTGPLCTAATARSSVTSTSAPAAASMRSVWSRVAAGSTTWVSPSASRPAISTHDLTWALATGSW